MISNTLKPAPQVHQLDLVCVKATAYDLHDCPNHRTIRRPPVPGNWEQDRLEIEHYHQDRNVSSLNKINKKRCFYMQAEQNAQQNGPTTL